MTRMKFCHSLNLNIILAFLPNAVGLLSIWLIPFSFYRVELTFIKANGETIKTKGKVGDSLLDVVVNNNIDLEGFGACEGTLTCSTCHLIFTKQDFDSLPEKPGDEELDMLDLAYELTDTSRLGCQITLTKSLNGLVVKVPSTINDARS